MAGGSEDDRGSVLAGVVAHTVIVLPGDEGGYHYERRRAALGRGVHFDASKADIVGSAEQDVQGVVARTHADRSGGRQAEQVSGVPGVVRRRGDPLDCRGDVIAEPPVPSADPAIEPTSRET